MKKICDKLETGCDFNCIECEIPQIEPEDCENCLTNDEESGIEYEANFTYVNGTWQCGNCGGSV